MNELVVGHGLRVVGHGSWVMWVGGGVGEILLSHFMRLHYYHDCYEQPLLFYTKGSGNAVSMISNLKGNLRLHIMSTQDSDKEQGS